MEFSGGSNLTNRRLFLTMGESCRVWGVIPPGRIVLFLVCLIVLDDLEFFAIELGFLAEAKPLPELTGSCCPPETFLMHLAFGHIGLISALRNRMAAIRSSALTLIPPF